MKTLFPDDQVVGVFRGFLEGGLEFHADLVLRYRSDLQTIPMHGQFVVVQLEKETEGVLGRITAITSEGRLATGQGEDYGIRAAIEKRPIPEDLREQYLRYRINIRVLGVVRVEGAGIIFAPSHRRLPHVGSKVAFLSHDLVKEVTAHNRKTGVELGFFALGEFIYSGQDGRLEQLPWMRIQPNMVAPRFDVAQLVARRTFIFARSGFGKSNLNKLLFSSLYDRTPEVDKRGGRRIPVGTIIFDPDGEYFWPDDKNNPGLCDVPHLRDRLVVFTHRQPPSKFYGAFVAGAIRIDIRRFRPNDVVSIALPADRQDQQNVRKLKQLNDHDWAELVDLIERDKNSADLGIIKKLLRLDAAQQQDAEALAARANMTHIVRMLHDPSSQMTDMLLKALREGKICVVDVSQMRGTPAFVLSGLILKRIFDHNQEEFTKSKGDSIPVIAVIEEAQAVLGEKDVSGEGPYVAWVKEGRKYDLGVVLITQQPGSIAQEILSQGDNWFVFHLLSSGDLQSLKKANAHFSDDLLSSLLNEPIAGNAVFWSGVPGGLAYPIPVRVLDFSRMHQPLDPDGNEPPAATYALELSRHFAEHRKKALEKVPVGTQLLNPTTDLARGDAELSGDGPAAGGALDTLAVCRQVSFRAVAENEKIMTQLKTRGLPWGVVLGQIKEQLPGLVEDTGERERIASGLVLPFLEQILGREGADWHTENRSAQGKLKLTLWIVPGAALSRSADGTAGTEGA
jgi:hypothetical protein